MNDSVETVENTKLTKAEKRKKCDRLLNELINAHDSFIIQSHNDVGDSTIVASMAIEHIERLVRYRREELPGEKTLTNKIKNEFDILVENRNILIEDTDIEELKKRVKVYLLKTQKGGNKHENRNTSNRKHAEPNRSSETTGTETESNQKD